MQFVSLHNLQNVPCNLPRVRIWVRLGLGRVGDEDRVRFRSEISKLCMHVFKIAQCILQIVQTGKLRTTWISFSNMITGLKNHIKKFIRS